MGWDYLGAVLDGDIKENDIVVMASLDGAQLYEDKDSDCWIYVWIIVNLSPDKQYRKVHILPGGFIPGPNKPKNLDSFLVISIHHLAALQKEGLKVWNASQNAIFQSDIHFLFPTADGASLAIVRKTQQSHYYPALLKQSDRACVGSDHGDINVFRVPPAGSPEYAPNLFHLMSALNQSQYEIQWAETSITKAPLILDIMHLAGNLSDLLISCATMDDVITWRWAILSDDNIWKVHGKAIHNAGQHIPRSFDAKPRNIAEKINTDYKTWEFQLYTFGLGPALLYEILPEPYWIHHCKLHSITAEEVHKAHNLLCSCHHKFEELYYQRREDRLHFVRPCVHKVIHLVPETIQKGPPICYAQWTMERTIGNFKQEVQQPSNYFMNIAYEGIKRSARLLLPNGQIVRSAWRKKLRPKDQLQCSHMIKFNLDGSIRFGEALYYTRIAVNEDNRANNALHFANVALVQLFSPPDNTLLQLSHTTVPMCQATQEDIISVVGMIPHSPCLPSGEVGEHFFTLERPGLNISHFIQAGHADDEGDESDTE
ncbi:hypothetical protein BS17DRAFT_796200 [Gyrodon lividus]|nr:hypothetical protein BS17DRAFT_796200 [Gyrodon lividus]